MIRNPRMVFKLLKSQNWFAIVQECLIQYHVIYCVILQEFNSHCILLVTVI